MVDFGQAQAAQGGVIAYGLDPAVMGDDGAVLRASDLATTIADEIGMQEAWTSAPSFSTKTFEPGRHRGHP